MHFFLTNQKNSISYLDSQQINYCQKRMLTKRLDKNLDELIINLKLTKPTSVEMFIKLGDSKIQKDNDLPRFNNLCQSKDEEKINNDINHNTLAEDDSVILDNYDEFNCYSFYELKESQRKLNEFKPQQQFSFCHHSQDKNIISQPNNNDLLSQFSSIVDKLKTEGDSLDFTQSNFFYSYDKDQQSLTERNKSNQEVFGFEQHDSENTERRHMQYFSDTMFKSNQKSYKNIMIKKAVENDLSKPKVSPIYAKLTLPVDKQNIHQNSNIIPKVSVISNISSQKSTYSSAIKKNSKKTENTYQKSTSKQLVSNPLNKQKIKELNDKIRKQNQITYQSEMKQKTLNQQTPLHSFKKGNIPPHKFSSYKVKLFG